MAKKSAVKKVLPRKPTEVANKTLDTCFVISPFGGWFDVYYKTIFDPAIKAAGLAPCRADDLYRPSSIIHDIWKFVRNAKLLLADLTGKNQNVLYELGLAHAIGKPVIMITQVLDDVPFDLRSLRVITYDLNDPGWADDLRTSLERAFSEILQAPQTAVPPPFLQVEETHEVPRVTPLERRVMELSQEVDSLRRSRLLGEESTGSPTMSPSEARDAIQRYVKRRMPRSVILDRLRSAGVPSNFIIRELEKAQYSSRQASLIDDDIASGESEGAIDN